jgi:DNA/RNA-binding domain of Phe-tRNA-synthetase-like protein
VSVLDTSAEVRLLGIPAFAMVFDRIGPDRAGAVEAAVDEAVAEVARLGEQAAVATHPYLVGYRALHERVGARARDVAAPEVLRRLVFQRGSIPRISPLVDLYNVVSLRTALAFGAHEQNAIVGSIDLRLLAGNERFTPLGTDSPSKVRVGEYAYVDKADDVLCRLEVRQGDKTKIRPSTSSCVVIVQGNPDTGVDAVEGAAREFEHLVVGCLGARTVEFGWG